LRLHSLRDTIRCDGFLPKLRSSATWVDEDPLFPQSELDAGRPEADLPEGPRPHRSQCCPPDDNVDAAVAIAQAECDQHHPEVVVGSSRGGAVAMNIDSGDTPLVLLCPAWKRWGTATTVKPAAIILHPPADDVVPFSDSEELLRNSHLPAESLIQVGEDHRLADPESLAKMLEVVERTLPSQ